MGPLADFLPIEDDGFMSNRKLAIDVIQKLPEDATRHDIAREIEFVAGVRQEFEQIERGEGVPAEQVLRYDPLMACKKGGTVGWAAIEHQLEMDCGAIGDGDVDLCVQRAAREQRFHRPRRCCGCVSMRPIILPIPAAESRLSLGIVATGWLAGDAYAA